MPVLTNKPFMGLLEVTIDLHAGDSSSFPAAGGAVTRQLTPVHNAGAEAEGCFAKALRAAYPVK